jgi:hypothetical protein
MVLSLERNPADQPADRQSPNDDEEDHEVTGRNQNLAAGASETPCAAAPCVERGTWLRSAQDAGGSRRIEGGIAEDSAA